MKAIIHPGILSFQTRSAVFDLPSDLLESPKLILALPLAPQFDGRAGRRVPVIG